MKSKYIKKAIVLLASSTMALSTAACFKSRETELRLLQAPQLPHLQCTSNHTYNIEILFLQTKPAEMDKVLAEFENRTKDTLNTKLDIEFASSELTQKLGLKMAVGEEVDLSFDYLGIGTLYQNIARGIISR